MKYSIYLIFQLILLINVIPLMSQSKSHNKGQNGLVDYVNPFIGTQNMGVLGVELGRPFDVLHGYLGNGYIPISPTPFGDDHRRPGNVVLVTYLKQHLEAADLVGPAIFDVVRDIAILVNGDRQLRGMFSAEFEISQHAGGFPVFSFRFS